MAEEILYLAAYDIRHPSRLREALHVLLDYSLGRQKSVFECPLSDQSREELLSRVADVIDPMEDRFALIRLDRRCATYTMGRAVALDTEHFFYVG
jgi:CRISPR-associated protein Cas2